MRSIGDIDLDRLATIRRNRGQDPLPYPFAFTTPRTDTPPVAVGDVDTVNAELHAWIDAFVNAEIWVSARVHHSDPETPGNRLLAYRLGTTGYVALQRDTSDTVEVWTLPANALAASVANAVGLTGPGRRSQIVVPGYVGYFAETTPDEFDDDDGYAAVRVSAAVPRTDGRLVSDDDVAAITTIESRSQPSRQWGMDWSPGIVVCVTIEDDGDYLYRPDFSYAVPATADSLAARIDASIARDLTRLRDADLG